METDSSVGRAIWTQPHLPTPNFQGSVCFLIAKQRAYLLYGEAKLCWSPEILCVVLYANQAENWKRTPLVSCGIRKAALLLRGYKRQRGTNNSNKKTVFLENFASCPIVKGTSQLQIQEMWGWSGASLSLWCTMILNRKVPKTHTYKCCLLMSRGARRYTHMLILWRRPTDLQEKPAAHRSSGSWHLSLFPLMKIFSCKCSCGSSSLHFQVWIKYSSCLCDRNFNV